MAKGQGAVGGGGVVPCLLMAVRLAPSARALLCPIAHSPLPIPHCPLPTAPCHCPCPIPHSLVPSSGYIPAMADERPRHFIQQLIDQHIAEGRWGPPGERGVVTTRFPPEPNGYLHIGHAKSISLNFGLAQEYGGRFFVRFDDTNPVKEEQEYVDSILTDVRWLGARWPGMADGAKPGEPAFYAGVKYASDYFQQMYDWAEELIQKGLAYVDDQTAEEISKMRGGVTEAGRPSPFRERSAAENLDLFRRMRKGEFPDGSRVLRAKIDMASPNMNLRDPVMYRILHAEHHRTGGAWCIYPMYDWAHGFEDSIEGITNSICTLEFENHRPLYDWFIDAVNKDRGPGSRWGMPIHHPQQTEFARFTLNYVVTSKRYLLELVKQGLVSGWDDPRMITVSGFRRRGYTAEAVRALVMEDGATKFNGIVDFGRAENAAREDLNKRAPRRMAVLNPLKLTITNWSDGGDGGRTEWLTAVNNPESEAAGQRRVPFGKTLLVERDDFMETPVKGWFRLAPGQEVRLRYGYWVTCREVVKNAAGEVVELRCTYDPQTKGGDSPPPDADGKVRKVKGTIHWVDATLGVPVSVRLFDRLYKVERPGKATGNHIDDLNPDSLSVLEHAVIEPEWRTSDAERAAGTGVWADGIERFQFERLGYFCVDGPETARLGRPVFNRTVTLKDSWAKEAGKA